MFQRKHVIPKEFHRDNTLLQENNKDKRQKSLLYKFCAVNGETEAKKKKQNCTLNLQIDELNSKLANSQDLQHKYKELKADRKAANDLNKNLEKQVHELHFKL